MNERIALLINRATTVEKGPPNWDLTANTVITTFDKEKFAELIIKECATLCDINDAVQDDGQGLGQGNIIKEHFGVEE